MQLANVFHARVVDVAPESLIVEMVGSEAKIDGCWKCCSRMACWRWFVPDAWLWLEDPALASQAGQAV
jgi:hypothetical protein